MSHEPDGRLEELLRATGRRPAPPPERAARVREAVRARWRGEQRRRRRRRALWIGVAAAAVAAAGMLAFLPRPGVDAPAARVERLELPGALRPGGVVLAGATVSTEGGGRLALRLSSGHALRLDRGTRVRVLSGRALALERGALYVDSAGAAQRVEIGTPFGLVRDEGTQFVVRVEARTLRLAVREGRAFLGAAEVAAGQLLEIDGDRRRLVPYPASGELWAWAGEIAPPPAIDGRTARDFLDWMARERGLELRFENAEVAAAAATTRLQGSVEGMTLDQALASVLPTCGMRHRIQDGVLLVAAMEPVQGDAPGRQ